MQCVKFVDKICLTFFSVTFTVDSYLFKYGDSQVCQGVPWLGIVCSRGLVNMLVDYIAAVVSKASLDWPLRLSNISLLTTVFVDSSMYIISKLLHVSFLLICHVFLL